MIRHILVGLGDSKYAASATKSAIQLARIHDAQLTGISVLDSRRIGATGPIPIGAGHLALELREQRLAEANKIIDKVDAQFEKACIKANVPYRIERPDAEPYQTMADLARYHDIIICGLRHLFEHGVVDEPPQELTTLVKSGVRPLIVVTSKPRKVRRVLIAYSGSMESAKTMKRFNQLQLWTDVAVRIVTFKHPKEKAEQLLADAEEYCRGHGYDVDTDYVPKSPKHELLPYAHNWNADLIVIGNSSRRLFLSRLFGETMLHTVQHSDLPLFLAQ